MVLTTLKQIKEADLQAICRQATISVSGYFYAVTLGPDVHPRYHYVGKDRRCTCGLGAECPAVQAVVEYLRSGGERAPDAPSGFFPVAPQACPICGAETYYVPSLNSRIRGAGWACAKSGKSHYWLARVEVLRKALAENPWLFPPVYAADGRVLYPGLKRDEIQTESGPWPEGYNPDR